MSGPFLFTVLHEDESLLVVHKPADLVCHPTKGDEYSSLISRARLHLGAAGAPQLLNRLDRETSGVTVIAKTAGAAREIRRLWEQRLVGKEYLALVHGRVAAPRGSITEPLGPDQASRVAIKDCVRPDGAAARTDYEVVTPAEAGLAAVRAGGEAQAVSEPTGGPATLLRVAPVTGRKHQIRIHLAHIGHPIIGDKLYGGDEDLYLALVEGRLTEAQRHRLVLPWHALHCRAVRFEWQGRAWEFTSPPEDWFVRHALAAG